MHKFGHVLTYAAKRIVTGLSMDILHHGIEILARVFPLEGGSRRPQIVGSGPVQCSAAEIASGENSGSASLMPKCPRQKFDR